MTSQRVPVMHWLLDVHSRVQRDAPPWSIGRHTRGEAQSPLVVQRSSSCRFIVPPALLDVDDELELDAEVDEDEDVDVPLEEDDEDDDVTVPELELPVLELLLPVVPLLDDEPPPVPLPGTHCAFWSQE
jgi:hypothetical protein